MNIGRKYSEGELLESLKRLAGELGHTPTQLEIADCRYCPAPQTYHKRFGSLTKACERIGLKPNPSGSERQFSDEQLKQSLREFVQTQGYIPVDGDLKRIGFRPTASAYRYRFGTLAKALSASGIRFGKLKYIMRRILHRAARACIRSSDLLRERHGDSKNLNKENQ